MRKIHWWLIAWIPGLGLAGGFTPATFADWLRLQQPYALKD